MSMFPTDIDIADVSVDTVDETQETVISADLGRSLKFDYTTNTFVIEDGMVIEPTKVDAIKQWIELFIRTEVSKYAIYTDNFGVDLKDLLGYRLPRGLQIAEIMRRINTGILNNCPNVTSVKDWSFDKGTFTFTVVTDTGEEVTISE